MDDRERREILRRAEHAVDDPDLLGQLAANGITLDEWQAVDGGVLLAELEDDEANEGPSIQVTLYPDETPSRDAIEGSLSEYVENSGIGRWLGSGHGSMGDRQFFDMAFEVTDLGTAISLIRAKLKALGAGPGTEISASNGARQGL